MKVIYPEAPFAVKPAHPPVRCPRSRAPPSSTPHGAEGLQVIAGAGSVSPDEESWGARSLAKDLRETFAPTVLQRLEPAEPRSWKETYDGPWESKRLCVSLPVHPGTTRVLVASAALKAEPGAGEETQARESHTSTQTELCFSGKMNLLL